MGFRFNVFCNSYDRILLDMGFVLSNCQRYTSPTWFQKAFDYNIGRRQCTFGYKVTSP
jgi:hypothetical protein